MKKGLFITLILVLMSGVSFNIIAQSTAYGFNGAYFSYGTIDLTTAVFTSLNFNPQGTSHAPVAADNVAEDEQYIIVSDFSYPPSYFLWHANFTTLSGDSIAPLGSLAAGQTQVKAFAHDNTTDIWYMISGDDLQTSAVLYTVDINTGATTVVGNIQNATYPVGMAIDCNGNAYIVSVEGSFPATAVLFSLDLSTAVATQIGTNLGFDNVFGGGQDMDFDPETGNLYWSAYWSDGFFSEGGSFRIIDVATGTSTEIGTFGQFENITGLSVKAACPLPEGPATYAFNGSFFTYGTIDLSTAQFTSLNFSPQGYSYYPLTADNDGISGQYAIMASFDLTGYYLSHINFTTLSSDSIAPVAPLASGQTQIKAIAHDTYTDIWYVISNDDFSTSPVLYTLDISTGVLSEIGQVQNASSPITLAIDCGGNAYIVNVEGSITTTAVLYSLDLSNAVATQVGTNLGFDNVTYGSQDMDFDPQTGNLYWSAYWASGFFDEGGSFRLIDISTGTSTELGTFGQYETITALSINDICIVPVELTSFNALVSGSSVTLNWTTATETNNNGFSVERKSNNSSWQEIAFVPGFGTSTEHHSYSYTDNYLNAGSYLYRLKQIDFDGTSEYSDIVNTEISAVSDFRLDQNYPNPFNPSTRISYSIPEQSFVSIKIFSITGEEVTSLVNGVQKEGRHEVIFDAKNLSSGIYIARMNAGSFSSTIKMNLLK